LIDKVTFKEKIRVCLNFFAECHGKSSRDAHFSVVDTFLKEKSRMSSNQIKSTGEVNYFLFKNLKNKM